MSLVQSVDAILTATGHGNLIPLVASLVALAAAVNSAASAVSTFYPPTWRGAATVHKLALMIGKAAPAVPAATVADTTTQTIPSPVPGMAPTVVTTVTPVQK